MMKLADYMETLEGSEFLSLMHERYVVVKNGQLLGDGMILEPRITLPMARYLFAEMYEQEMGGSGCSVEIYDAARAASKYAKWCDGRGPAPKALA